MKIVYTSPNIPEKYYSPLSYSEFSVFRENIQRKSLIKKRPRNWFKVSQASMLKQLTMWDVVTHPLMEME